MTTNEQIELVARVLCDFDVYNNGGYIWDHRGDSWGSDYENGRDYYREMAETALTAAAVPTVMVEADTVIAIVKVLEQHGIFDNAYPMATRILGEMYKLTSRAVPEPDADAVKHLQEFADMFHFAWGLWAAQDGATPLETEHLKRAMDDVFWSDMILKWSEMVEEGIIANPGLEAQDREIEDVKNRPALLLPEYTRAALSAVPTVQAAAGDTDWRKEGTMLDRLKEAATSGSPFMLTVRDDEGEKQYRFWPEEMIKATNGGVKKGVGE